INVSTNATSDPGSTEVTTSEVSYDSHVPRYSTATLATLCVLLGCMIVATVLGNVFVITAIIVERSLQGVSNYLVLSLAVTDLLVAVLVMPLSLLNEVSVYWYLGRVLCDMWVSMDVLCCTASILHLVAIAFDRFWAVSNIDYVRRRCARQIIFMIALVWLVSVVISIPPLFGWRHDTDNPELSGVCMISQDHGYTIFSTVGAFYCPMVLMLVLNFKIYRAARYRIRRKGFAGRNTRGLMPVPAVQVEETTNQRATNQHSSGSDVSQDGYSLFDRSCMVNNELSRMDVDTGFDSATDMVSTRYVMCPGESTTEGSGNESCYYARDDDDDFFDSEPPSPTPQIAPGIQIGDDSPPAPLNAKMTTVESRTSDLGSELITEHSTISVGNGHSHSHLVPPEPRPLHFNGRVSPVETVGNHLNPSEPKLVQFSAQVRVEGGSPDSGHSLRPLQYEPCCDISNEEHRLAPHRQCVSCFGPDSNNEVLCVEKGGVPLGNHGGQLGLQSPSLTTRKNSGIHLSPVPRSVQMNNLTNSSYTGSNQLTVPRAVLSGSQTSKSRANNNTKRARNREKEKQRREKLEMRRERKAARVLGIITGAFVVCWLPFFILALLIPFCSVSCHVPDEVASLCLWLGYFNSLLNPIIYTVFNPSFRNAFRKIFFRRLRSVTR
ncbi:hypothetical protein BaRGS_00015505, partial [Batillaria attramentaria]